MTDNMKNGQESEEENYIPKNPDGDFDIRSYLGHGDLYTQWLQRITEKDRLIQQERLKEYGKDLPEYLPSGEKVSRQGYRMGLRYLTPAERSKGRKPGGRDKVPRLVNKSFGTAEKKIFLKNLEKSGSIVSAAAMSGFSRFTAYDHMNKDKRFKELVEIAKANHNGKIRQSIVDRIQNGDVTVKYDSTGKVISKEVKPISSAVLLHYIQSNDDEFMKKGQTTTHLHIGDESSSNSRLLALAQKLNVTLPDNSGKDDDDIIDIN